MVEAFVRGGSWRVCWALSRPWGFVMGKVAWKKAAQENRAGSGTPEEVTAVMMLTTFSE